MFVRPEQVAALVERIEGVERARVVVTRDGTADVMTVQLEGADGDPVSYADEVRAVLKLRGEVDIVPPGSLPRDGIVIEDQRPVE